MAGTISGWCCRIVKARPGPARLAALDPEQLPMALAFLSGYHPRVFDAILDAVEPCAESDIADDTPGQEQFCVKRGAPVGVFLAHGKAMSGVESAAALPVLITARLLVCFYPRGMEWYEYLDQVWNAYEAVGSLDTSALPALQVRSRMPKAVEERGNPS